MKVDYYHTIAHGYANIMFSRRWPMRGGRFPSDHPCSDDPSPMMMLGEQRRVGRAADDPVETSALGRFRLLGYGASCFPEGDGIAILVPDGKSAEEVAADISDCFGWSVKIKRR